MAPVVFDEGYNKKVIDLPVKFPSLFDFGLVHEARVTVAKLSDLYQVMYSFSQDGDQTIVPTKVRMPVLHNFNYYNEDIVTVGTLQALYKCLYKIEGSILPKTPLSGQLPTTLPPARKGAADPGPSKNAQVTGATGGASLSTGTGSAATAKTGRPIQGAGQQSKGNPDSARAAVSTSAQPNAPPGAATSAPITGSDTGGATG